MGPQSPFAKVFQGARMIRLVVFDAYGTLFDVHSVAALAESLFPGKAMLCLTSGETSKSNTAA